MRSLKQIEASRSNGAKSKGPVTAAGKQRSSQNSIRHGLASKVVLLANESREEYDRVLNAYIARYRPADEPERDLVGDIVAARWRLNRTLALEAASFDHEMDRQSAAIEQDYQVIDEETRCALALKALTDNSRALAHLSRHESRIRRSMARAIDELRTMQSERKEIFTDEPKLAAA